MRPSRPRRAEYPLSRTLGGAGDFGAAVRAARRSAEVPIDKAAGMLGVSKQFLSDLENGKPTIQLDKAIKAGRALGLVIDYRVAAAPPVAAEEVAPYEVIAPRASHRRREQQSLALHRAIARKLVTNPEAVVAKARSNLSRWTGKGTAKPLYAAWNVLLGLPPAVLAEVMTCDTDEAAQLRQSTPFAGVLSPQERDEILAPFLGAGR